MSEDAQAQLAAVQLSDAVCEVRCLPRLATPCGRRMESIDARLDVQSYYASINSSPAPALIWETACASPLRSANNTTAVSPPRTAILLPGAWAIGEGVLVGLDEQYGLSTSPVSGSPRSAATWTATMGSYLTSWANAISSCSRSTTHREGSDFLSPGDSSGSPGSCRSPAGWQRAPDVVLANKKGD
ncbi:hypothetical protein PLESTB_001739300 [Pleodorina starrii]|uniref:Uncharacterized protein n=1 Tax=Pleodorina starrii TaxID=330485 RepID=A0A9W6C0L1_9CHLO|nr:hypothetical protein PLESTM_000747400 [Pleodorina starrii]GLC61282.1 hypothetical protein PLESTB_001739300 [Pleodorina starrii]GLC74712.1 hypothetical protein PLESTF_001547300 [Pleodorina starrii]